MLQPSAHRIRELRDQADLSLRALAEKISMPLANLQRIEAGTTQLNITDMRKIAHGLGRKASALLIDEDIEIRAGSTDEAILAVLSAIPEDEKMAVLKAAVELVRVCRRVAGAGALAGDRRTAERLADLWGDLSDDQRERAVAILRVSLKPEGSTLLLDAPSRAAAG